MCCHFDWSFGNTFPKFHSTTWYLFSFINRKKRKNKVGLSTSVTFSFEFYSKFYFKNFDKLSRVQVLKFSTRCQLDSGVSVKFGFWVDTRLNNCNTYRVIEGSMRLICSRLISHFQHRQKRCLCRCEEHRRFREIQWRFNRDPRLCTEIRIPWI